MMRNRQALSSPSSISLKHRQAELDAAENALVEEFLVDFRGNQVPIARANQSNSIAVVHKAACVLYKIVEQFGENEQSDGSTGKLALQHGEDAVKVATEQVQRLIRHVSRAGKNLQRAVHFRLLLGNVTYRVLSIIRDAATAAATTPQNLEEAAKLWLSTIKDTNSSATPSDNEPDEDDDEEASGSSTEPDETMVHQRTASSDLYADVELSGDEGTQKNKAAKEAMPKRKLPSSPKSDKSPNTLGKMGKNVRFSSRDNVTDAPRPTSSSIPIAKQSQANSTDDPSGSYSSDHHSTPHQHGVKLTRAASVVGEEYSHAKLYPIRFDDFIERALLGISEFETTLDDMTHNLCENAGKQLHDQDIVMTLGVSHSTKNFLTHAADEMGAKKFKVILIDPSYGGSASSSASEKLASALRLKGVEVTILPDSSAFAVMDICSKVVVGCDNVLANGGLLAPIGTYPLCIAAKYFAVPVIVVAMTLKMTPYYPSDALCSSLVKIRLMNSEEHQWKQFGHTGDVLPLDQLHHVDYHVTAPINAPNQTIEYVPADLISLFSTNDGEYTVHQIHCIVRDHYNVED